MNLVLDAVCKRFGDGKHAQLVLDRISLAMHTGQFLALLGSSGSGKSTLMRLVAGLEQPSSGSISLDGQPIRGPGSDRGMVFQKYSLYPWLTAAQNVAFGMELQGLERAEIRERTGFYLEVVGLAESARRLPRELSGGMQQRVAIARSLLHDPDILLMDEPFSALDALTRDEMSVELLRIWSERPKTVVFVTHSIQEAVLLSDRIVVMSPRPGRVERIIEVPIRRPRGLETLSDPVLHALVDDIRRSVFSRPAKAAS